MPGVIQAFFVNCSRVEAKEVNGCAADFSYRRFELHPCSLTQVDFFCCQIKKALSSYQAFFQKTDANIALIFSPSKFTYMKKENVSFFCKHVWCKRKINRTKNIRSNHQLFTAACITTTNAGRADDAWPNGYCKFDPCTIREEFL